MPRQQINIKLPPELIEALREKASTEEITLTELIQGYCEQGLGLPPSNHQPVDTASIYERILTEVDNRIAVQLDIRIPELEEPLLTQLEERIAFVVDARISSQVALLEQRMATQLGENIREGFSRACEVGKELGRELERAKQQSPYPDESAIGEGARLEQHPNEIVEATTPALEPVEVFDELSAIPNIPVSQEVGFSISEEGETATFLAERFKKSVSTVTRAADKLSKEKFKEWSRKLDPDGIAWEYRNGEGKKKFHPVNSSITP